MIVIISSNHFPDDERIYHKQIKSLTKVGKKVLYITRSTNQINLSDDYVNHQNFNLSQNNFIKKIKSILIKKDNVTHLQIHETNLLLLIRFIKLLKPSIITIYDVHEDMVSLYRTFTKRTKLISEVSIFFRKKKEEKFLKFVDRIILANPTIKKDRYGKFKIEQIILENFPEKKYIVNSLRNRVNKPFIIYHGHLAPERGISVIIVAMGNVIKVEPKAKLTLLGSFRTSKFKKEIFKLIKINSLEKHIRIDSQIPHKEVWGVLKKHSIGVIPFRRNPLTENNTPTKLFEMMASGLEIIATDLPPVKYFLNKSIFWANAGSPFSIGTNLLTAIKNLELKSNLEINLELVNKKYNWESIESKYLSIFK